MKDKITITMPYYEAPEMLKVHLENWCAYPDALADRVNIVLVDDGSPKYPAVEVLKSAKLPRSPIKLYRIQENIPWNHGGARNLGMHNVPDGWVVTTDIDLVLDAENAEKILDFNKDSKRVYQPNRLDLVSGEWVEMKRHPESFVMTKKMFWNIGGFDEDFTGWWNGTFTPFRKALQKKASIVSWEDIYLKNHSDLVEGAMVSEWGRRGSAYDIHSDASWLFKRRIATRHYQPKNPLRFNWEQVV